MDNREIVLTGYGAATFLADLEFSDKKIDTEYVSQYNKSKITKNPNGSISFKSNPNYPYKTRDEERIARHKHEQKRRDFIYNFLKEKYTKKDYAEEFLKNNNWDKPLRYHNTETKECKHLDSDGSHCTKKRNNTSCYTCCFSCVLPKTECNKGECAFIKY